MTYIPAILILAILFGAAYIRGRLMRPRPSDLGDIRALLDSRGLRFLKSREAGDQWRYWLRGKLLLSNVARIFVVDVEDAQGQRKEIHIAFDPMRKEKGAIILEETEVPRSPNE